MMRSARQQVAALVVLSIVATHLIILAGIVMMDRTDRRFFDHTALELAARLYGSQPALRPDLLRDCQLAGMKLTELTAAQARACERDESSCPAPLEEGVVQATPQTWLAATPTRPPPRPRHPLHHAILLLSGVALPALALSIWAARRITAPLLRLADRAEHVDPEHVAAPLPVEGTSEIRLLAEAFNRLILRLTRYAAEQRRMLAAVSHDLRTPLTRLRLKVDSVPDEGLRSRLVRDLDAMSGLIASTLGLLQAQDSAAGRELVDIGALAETVADDFIESGASLSVDPPARTLARCDRMMITRALINVIDNALRYGRTARVRVQNMAGNAVIEVADEGPGLTAEQKARAFEPWYRGDAARTSPGSGLGLAIARAAMEAHGGTIALLDNPAGGLLVRMSLPHASA